MIGILEEFRSCLQNFDWKSCKKHKKTAISTLHGTVENRKEEEGRIPFRSCLFKVLQYNSDWKSSHLCLIFSYYISASMKSSDGSFIEIAIKAPKMCLLNEGAVVDFHEKAKTTISLKHDNIVKCLGYGNTGCGFFKGGIQN